MVGSVVVYVVMVCCLSRWVVGLPRSTWSVGRGASLSVGHDADVTFDLVDAEGIPSVVSGNDRVGALVGEPEPAIPNRVRVSTTGLVEPKPSPFRSAACPVLSDLLRCCLLYT